MSRVLVAIPAWNEEPSIPEVITNVASHRPDADILVVDDGSTDNTAKVAAKAGAAVVPPATERPAEPATDPPSAHPSVQEEEPVPV